jgi:hypothetical protein
MSLTAIRGDLFNSKKKWRGNTVHLRNVRPPICASFAVAGAIYTGSVHLDAAS